MKASDFCNMRCRNCSFNDGLCYTSYPPKYRCTFDNNFYDGDHSCHLELTPVRHGKWICVDSEPWDIILGFYYCSECRMAFPFHNDPVDLTNFCPSCGAKNGFRGI